MKKQKEGEILKNTVKTFVYKTGKAFGKALFAAGLVATLIFGLVACNNDKEDSQTGPDTGIVQPGGDEEEGEQGGNQGGNQGGETTNPDNPGGDIEQPEDPDQGDEDEGDDEQGGEVTPPIEDDDNDKDDEEELEPPQSVEDLLINPDYQNSEYMIKVEDALNTYLKEKIINKANSNLDEKNIDEIEWRIEGNNTNTSINNITISFVNCASDTSRTIYVQSVTPKGGLTLEDLYNPDETKLNNAFNTAIIGGAKYQNLVTFEYDPSIQEASADLTEALKNVAIKDKDLEIEIDENTEYYIVDRGAHLDTVLGEESREVVLFIKTDNGYQKTTYMLGNPTFDMETLLKEINQGEYRKVYTETGKLSGHQITVIEEDEAASTASEAYRYYGKVETEDGSVVKLYVPEYMMNDFEQN